MIPITSLTSWGWSQTHFADVSDAKCANMSDRSGTYSANSGGADMFTVWRRVRTGPALREVLIQADMA